MPICAACGDGPRTVGHYLLECWMHKNYRRDMHRVLYPGIKVVSILLSNPNVLKILFIYIHTTI